MSSSLPEDPAPRNAIVLAIDRLHAGLVGAYGNAWIRTPQFDRLAAESFIFDQAYADSPQLVDIYRGWWQGIPAVHDPAAIASASLAARLTAAGWHAALVTDSREVAEMGGKGVRTNLPGRPGGCCAQISPDPFAAARWIEPRGVRKPAAAVEKTHVAHVLDEAAAVVRGLRRPLLLWVHLDLAAVWDAPVELRDRYADAEDPTPSRATVPPNRRLADDCDPDELLPFVHAYAGQVATLDECLGRFWESLGDVRDDTLLVVVGARGYPLGEHGRLGPCDEPLFNEVLQQVALWRFPDGRSAAQRSGALVVPADLPGTVLACLGVPPDRAARAGPNLLALVDGQAESLRDRIVVRGAAGERAIRTPAWLCTLSADDPPAVQLFSKPADRWEVNEVTDRAAQIAEQLQAVLARSLSEPAPMDGPPLAAELVTEVD